MNVQKNKVSIGNLIFKYSCLIVLIAYSLSMILTFLFSFMTSLKTNDAYEMALLALPVGENFTIKNYIEVWQVVRIKVAYGNTTRSVNVFGMIVNSLVFSVGGSFLSTLACCIMAYACARFKNWMSKFIYGIVVVCMALPIVGSLPSELQVLISLNLYDKRIGLVLLSASFLGIHFLIFHATFSSLPKDFSEAAKIDGASELRILVSIYLPLARLTFSLIFLLKFIALWNNYETPLIHTPDYPVLALGVFNVYKNESVTTGSGIRANTMPHKLAVSMIVLLPMLILFLFTHEKLIGNVSMGGVKG